MRRALAILFATAFTSVPARADAPGSVVVVMYAGSLVATMEGPITDALRDQGIELVGEPGGSKQLTALIATGAKKPDVFIAVDRANVDRLGSKVASATTFGSTRLGMAWEGKSNYAYVFTSVATGETPWLVALAQPGLRIGRTDPDLDPKGRFTIDALSELIGPANEKRILGADNNPQQIYPESELLARLESGDIDVGFFYQAEAAPHKIPFWPFPGETSMSDKATYTLAVMKDAPHPEAAQAFARFVLTGPGSLILEDSGVIYASRGTGTP